MATNLTVKAGIPVCRSALRPMGDLVVNGGAMFVLWGGVADTTTVDAGGVYVLD
jgi:hypothetical protein